MVHAAGAALKRRAVRTRKPAGGEANASPEAAVVPMLLESSGFRMWFSHVKRTSLIWFSREDGIPYHIRKVTHPPP